MYPSLDCTRPRLWPFAALALIVAAVTARAQEADESATTKGPLAAYVETIPGTDVTFEMVPIPGGTFTIGSPEDEPDRGEDEGPQRQVHIAPFWMEAHEVTWDEYDEFAFSLEIKRRGREAVDLAELAPTDRIADAVTRPTPPYADETFGLGRKNQPVICITHHAAMEYCRWLSAKTGKVYRLPTEAEWEYAARAGTETAYSFGDDIDEIDDYAWYVETAETPQKVGTKKPNPWGLHDMHGNVAEWVLDHYQPDAYEGLPADHPADRPVVLPDAEEYSYVARGGSWDDDPEELRSAARRGSNKEWSMQDPQRPQSIWWHTDATFVGFRVVRAAEEQPELVGLKSQVIKQKGSR